MDYLIICNDSELLSTLKRSGRALLDSTPWILWDLFDESDIALLTCVRYRSSDMYCVLWKFVRCALHVAGRILFSRVDICSKIGCLGFLTLCALMRVSLES